jgi:hypothetical protein
MAPKLLAPEPLGDKVYSNYQQQLKKEKKAK